jgi:ribosomal protein S18 acetylase RimI-like enzyme
VSDHEPLRFALRDATPNDAASIVAFNRAMALETEDKQLDAARLQRGVQKVLADAARGQYFVAVVEDDDGRARVVGQLMITREWSDWRDGWFLWIQSVYVDPGFRRRGIYRALHEHVLQRARVDDDVCGVRLYVEPDNARAKETYRALGMDHAYDVFEQKP